MPLRVMNCVKIGMEMSTPKGVIVVLLKRCVQRMLKAESSPMWPTPISCKQSLCSIREIVAGSRSNKGNRAKIFPL
ncbi:hypothetical protein D3C71_1566290 [compost metagenome]